MKADDVDIICDICDEFIQIGIHEDTNKAYARHSETEYHLEIEKRFHSIKYSGNHAFSSKSISSAGDEKNNSAVSAEFPKTFSLFYCRICQIDLDDSPTMMRHLKSEKHLKLESFIKEVSVQRVLLQLLGFSLKQNFLTESKELLSYFSNHDSNGMRICLVCDAQVMSEEYYLNGHINGDEKHRIKLQSMFINLGKDYSFYCIICNAINKGEPNLKEHCEGIKHRSSIDLLFELARHGKF